eukprot:TRINITY_DN2153_c0_g3_i1.p1 TRINITY_DN2153_c0_g3~~TRINITY_DN2153_c0_g3_i1.p1  ORF type:complete len:223 (-),score=-5.40 TRINITY_DN2153_c0_g3_i1:84-752(-)
MCIRDRVSTQSTWGITKKELDISKKMELRTRERSEVLTNSARYAGFVGHGGPMTRSAGHGRDVGAPAGDMGRPAGVNNLNLLQKRSSPFKIGGTIPSEGPNERVDGEEPSKRKILMTENGAQSQVRPVGGGSHGVGNGLVKGLKSNPLASLPSHGRAAPLAQQAERIPLAAQSQGRAQASSDVTSSVKLKYFAYVKPQPRVSKLNEFIPVLPFSLIKSKTNK